MGVSEASINQAEASLARAQRNLGYCIIKSPVSGVIIDRRVDIGQTVVASLNAPSLFLIAKDLKKVEVWVAVNEADIGNISPGQPASFTVDANPGEIFKATVEKIRLNASMTQNVVTYTVELITDNSSGRLLPYLTANVRFEVAKRDNVLQVPNAVLRYNPRAELLRKAGSAEESAAEKPDVGPGNKEAWGRIWLQDGRYLKPVKVKLGLTDGSMTEVSSDELKEGMEVISGEQNGKDGGSPTQTTNPFVPTMRRGGARAN